MSFSSGYGGSDYADARSFSSMPKPHVSTSSLRKAASQQQQHRKPSVSHRMPAATTTTQPPSLSPLANTDTISLRCLHTHATVGPDAWARHRSQPLILSLYLTVDTTSAGRNDDLKETFSYGQMAKDVVRQIEGKEFMNIDHLTSDLASLADHWPGEMLRVVAQAPKALLRSEGGLERELLLQRRAHDDPDEQARLVWHVVSHNWTVAGVTVACVIGVNDHERLERQNVAVRIKAMGGREKEDYGAQIQEGGEMWRRLVRVVCEVVEPSSFLTLEALVASVARSCLEEFPFPSVTVAVEKPSALTFVEGAGVEVTRDREWLRTQ